MSTRALTAYDELEQRFQNQLYLQRIDYKSINHIGICYFNAAIAVLMMNNEVRADAYASLRGRHPIVILEELVNQLIPREHRSMLYQRDRSEPLIEVLLRAIDGMSRDRVLHLFRDMIQLSIVMAMIQIASQTCADNELMVGINYLVQSTYNRLCTGAASVVVSVLDDGLTMRAPKGTNLMIGSEFVLADNVSFDSGVRSAYDATLVASLEKLRVEAVRAEDDADLYTISPPQDPSREKLCIVMNDAASLYKRAHSGGTPINVIKYYLNGYCNEIVRIRQAEFSKNIRNVLVRPTRFSSYYVDTVIPQWRCMPSSSVRHTHQRSSVANLVSCNVYWEMKITRKGPTAAWSEGGWLVASQHFSRPSVGSLLLGHINGFKFLATVTHHDPENAQRFLTNPQPQQFDETIELKFIQTPTSHAGACIRVPDFEFFSSVDAGGVFHLSAGSKMPTVGAIFSANVVSREDDVYDASDDVFFRGFQYKNMTVRSIIDHSTFSVTFDGSIDVAELSREGTILRCVVPARILYVDDLQTSIQVCYLNWRHAFSSLLLNGGFIACCLYDRVTDEESELPLNMFINSVLLPSNDFLRIYPTIFNAINRHAKTAIDQHYHKVFYECCTTIRPHLTCQIQMACLMLLSIPPSLRLDKNVWDAYVLAIALTYPMHDFAQNIPVMARSQPARFINYLLRTACPIQETLDYVSTEPVLDRETGQPLPPFLTLAYKKMLALMLNPRDLDDGELLEFAQSSEPPPDAALRVGPHIEVELVKPLLVTLKPFFRVVSGDFDLVTIGSVLGGVFCGVYTKFIVRSVDKRLKSFIVDLPEYQSDKRIHLRMYLLSTQSAIVAETGEEGEEESEDVGIGKRSIEPASAAGDETRDQSEAISARTRSRARMKGGLRENDLLF